MQFNYRHPVSGCLKNQSESQGPPVNPVTGEKLNIIQTQKMVKSENIFGVPLLDLNYLKENEKKISVADIDIDDYSLDTPNSANNVSQQTQRSYKEYLLESTKKKILSKPSVIRPEGVPGLILDVDKPEFHKSQENQDSAWNIDPVPLTLPQPSARHKEMYKQYSEEMKQSYRDHVKSFKFQPGADSTGERALTTTKTGTHQDYNDEKDDKAKCHSKNMHHKSASLQQCTAMKKLKKQDALNRDTEPQSHHKCHDKRRRKKKEDLLDKNKKHKLVETVMIDQLSRANTRVTATENLLSRRVRFGARILTQNDHDALRELTGFFFQFDKTLTVYEFIQFGKSAKALPFIYRGQYVHLSGSLQGIPYSLSDIYVGANLKISTKEQLAMTDSLARKSYITLRITDVDENEKAAMIALMNPEDKILDIHREMEMKNMAYLHKIQDCVRKQIHKRSIRTITGLGRFYRKIDQYNTGILDQFDLEKGLQTFHISLKMEELEQIFEILDPEGSKTLDYKEYMRGIFGEMSEMRTMLVRKAFLKLDSVKKGSVCINEVKKFFCSKTNKITSDEFSRLTSRQDFLDAVQDSDTQDITYLQFEEYYEGLSVLLDSDETFTAILCDFWNI